MTGIIRALITILALVYGCKLISFIAKRSMLLWHLRTLKRECNAKIRLHFFIFRPMWLVPKGPDATVEIGNTVYLIRLYSGGGKYRSVHFATEEYSCVYTRFRASARAPQGRGASSLALSSGVNLSAVVNRLPPFTPPKEYEGTGKRIVRVMILNPAPGVVSYVTKEKTSIKIAFTGDEMHGMLVFTADSFVRYADRMKREEERLAREASGLDYFYGDFDLE